MPALLVLEFCENGTLLDHISGSDKADLDTSMLLTYCHDVACGMQYLSSRRVVHRDIAARNVLMDAVLTCKVSDFGMSAALSGGGEESDCTLPKQLTSDVLLLSASQNLQMRQTM